MKNKEKRKHKYWFIVQLLIYNQFQPLISGAVYFGEGCICSSLKYCLPHSSKRKVTVLSSLPYSVLVLLI